MNRNQNDDFQVDGGNFSSHRNYMSPPNLFSNNDLRGVVSDPKKESTMRGTSGLPSDYVENFDLQDPNKMFTKYSMQLSS